jgi:hypothetical protein
MDPCILFRNDKLPSIDFQISNESGVVDLSAATTIITFKMRAKGTTTVLSTIVATKESGSGVTGWVNVAFTAGALTNLVAGRYEGEISVDFDGSVQTVAWYYHHDDVNVEDYAETFPIKLRADF